jgi:uncharacterized protein
MTVDATKALGVMALLDGRPGHEKQTMGIIQALQKKVPVQLTRMHAGSFSVLDRLIQTCRLYLPGPGLSHPHMDQVDLLIGTGSRTHLPMLLFKKKYAIPAITCMAPARHLENRFDLCFVPEHDGRSEGKNIMLTIGAPNQSHNKRVHRKECGLILLGGIDPKSHHWESGQVVRMVEKIIATDRQKSWTMSSSPRTPQDTVAMLKQLLKQYDDSQFFAYKDTPPGWIEEQYDQNKVVWVTADSISMIYEAITAGCSVGVIPMQWLSPNSKFKRNEDVLLANSLITPFSSWEKGHMTWDETRELNEAERCADRILQQWWPKKVV